MGSDAILSRQLLLSDAALARARGPQGRTRVRPAGFCFERSVRIEEATWIQEDDTGDHSGDAVLYGRTTDDSSFYRNRRIALQFPHEIAAKGPFFIAARADASTVVTQWDPTAASSSVKAWGEANALPILNWNGLKPATLIWANQGALDLGGSIGNPAISLCFSDLNGVSLAGGAGMLGSGIADNLVNRQPNTVMLAFDCGSGITMRGLLFEVLLWYINVAYVPGGYVQTELRINRYDNADDNWSLAALYNPT